MTTADRLLAERDGLTDQQIHDAAREENRCVVLYALGRFSEAIAAGLRAIEIWPSYAQAHRNLAPLYSETLEHEKAKAYLLRATELAPSNLAYLSEYLFLLDLADDSPEKSLAVRRTYNDLVIKPLLPDAMPSLKSHEDDPTIRVGYVSADFCQHSAPFTFSAMLRAYNPGKFSVYAYGSVATEDEMTAEIRKSVSVFRNVYGWSDELLTQQIRKDEIDILIDLSGFTKGSRLSVFARRPAPIQLSGWGYATGMSLDCFDGFFTDQFCVPPEDEEFFTEPPIHLPCALSWMPPHFLRLTPPVDAGDGQFTFGVFTRQQKITREAVETWAEILKQSPDSRLIIKNVSFRLKDIQQLTMGIFRDFGVADRVILKGATNHRDHMFDHKDIHLMLDTFPHGNGVTAFETLWMGVPMLTLYGKRVSGRITSSILKNINRERLVTYSIQGYIQRAVYLSENRDVLKGLSEGLPKDLNNSPMMLHTLYAHTVYDILYKMIQQKRDNLIPA